MGIGHVAMDIVWAALAAGIMWWRVTGVRFTLDGAYGQIASWLIGPPLMAGVAGWMDRGK